MSPNSPDKNPPDEERKSVHSKPRPTEPDAKGDEPKAGESHSASKPSARDAGQSPESDTKQERPSEEPALKSPPESEETQRKIRDTADESAAKARKPSGKPATEVKAPHQESKGRLPQPKKAAATPDQAIRQYDPEVLKTKSKDELIDIIIRLNSEMIRSTSRVKVDVRAKVPTYKTGAKVEKFTRLPVTGSQKKLAQTDNLWRVVLISSNPEHEPVGLEISGDVIMGRSSLEAKPDLDLTPFDAGKAGVSRRHAILRPTKSGLVLVDLRSTNGTFHNSKRLEAGAAQRLKDGDTVSLGRLDFKLVLAEPPAPSSSKAAS